MVIDANIVLRHLLADHDVLSARANEFLEPIRTGRRQGILLHVVLAECAYVLQRQRNIPRGTVAAQLLIVCSYKGLIGESLELAGHALDLYASSNSSFVDCLVLCTAREKNMDIMTFDRDLMKLASRLSKF
jgi:predicted nucleic acid-binding protein